MNEPLDEVQWRAPAWIQMHGLRTDNVLEYFSQSPFFDRSSNNQVLKMQLQFDDNAQNRREMFKELKNMKGIEYAVHLAREPDMWIVRKQNRLSPDEVRILATYFVLRENIFMAPAIHAVVQSRLLSSALALSGALQKAVSLPKYSPSQGYSYTSDVSSLLSNQDDGSSTPSAKTAGSKTRVATPAATPGGTQANINSMAIVGVADERTQEQAMQRALRYAVGNTNYLDSEPVPIAATAVAKAPSSPQRKRRR